MKMCKQIFKKTAPPNHSNSLICKKNSRAGPDLQFREPSVTKGKTKTTNH